MTRRLQLAALYGRNIILCDLLILYHQFLIRVCKVIGISLSHKNTSQYIIVS